MVDYEQDQSGMRAGEPEVMQAYDSIYNPFKDSALIKWQQDTTEIIESLKLQMQGFEFDLKVQKWVKKGEAMISDEGLHRLLTFLMPFFNKIAVMSSYDIQEIRRMCFDMRADMTCWLAQHQVEYAIDKRNLQQIKNTFFYLAFSLIKRAHGAGDRDYSKGVYRLGDRPMGQQREQTRATL